MSVVLQSLDVELQQIRIFVLVVVPELCEAPIGVASIFTATTLVVVFAHGLKLDAFDFVETSFVCTLVDLTQGGFMFDYLTVTIDRGSTLVAI